MKLLSVTLVLVIASVMSGCGGTAASGDGNAADLAAAKSVVSSYIDRDSCANLSPRLLKESSPDNSDPVAACKEDPFDGMRAGEYKIRMVQVSADDASVDVEPRNGELITYALIRSDGRWLIDRVTQKKAATATAPIGKPLWSLSQVTLNGTPIDVRLVSTVLAAAPADDPSGFQVPTSGRRFWRARATIKSQSSGTVYISVQDFALVAASGERYQGGSVFDPPIGNDSSDIAPGDKLTGYVSFEVPKDAKIVAVQFDPACCGNTGQSPLKWTLR